MYFLYLCVLIVLCVEFGFLIECIDCGEWCVYGVIVGDNVV